MRMVQQNHYFEVDAYNDGSCVYWHGKKGMILMYVLHTYKYMWMKEESNCLIDYFVVHQRVVIILFLIKSIYRKSILFGYIMNIEHHIIKSITDRQIIWMDSGMDIFNHSIGNWLYSSQSSTFFFVDIEISSKSKYNKMTRLSGCNIDIIF